MVVLLWAILALLVAAIAKLVLWDEEPVGWLPVLLVGLAGGVIGGLVRNALGGRRDLSGFDLSSMGLAIAGSALLLWAYHRFVAPKPAAPAVRVDRSRRAA